MLPINFEPTAELHPELATAIRAIQAWIAQAVGVRFLELARLSRDLSDISSKQLALALNALVLHDQLRMVFRVRDLNQHLLPENYDDLTDIPDLLLSREDQYTFKSADGEIVHGFLLEPKRVAV